MGNCTVAESCASSRGVRNVNLSSLGSETPKILVVTDFPSDESDIKNYLYGEELHQSLLFQSISEAGLDYSDIRFTSLVKCGCSRDNPPSEEVTNRCVRTNLMPEIMKYSKSIEIIIPLGASAKDFILPGEAGVTTIAGRVFERDFGFGKTFKIIPNLSPFFLARNANAIPKFKDIWTKVSRLLEAGKLEEFPRKNLTSYEFYQYFRRLIKYEEEGRLPYAVYDIETSNEYDGEELLEKLQVKEQRGYYITGFSIADPVERIGYYMTIYHPDMEKNYGRDYALMNAAFMRSTLELFIRKFNIVTHNCQFDIPWTSKELGIPTQDFKLVHDTLALTYLVIGRDRRTAFGLKDLGKFYFEIQNWDDTLDEELEKLKPLRNRKLTNVPLSIVSSYGSMDAIVTLKILEMFIPKLEELSLTYIYNILIQGMQTFARISSRGVPVHADLLQYISSSYDNAYDHYINELQNIPQVAYWRQMNAIKKKDGNWEYPVLVPGGNAMKEFVFDPRYLGAPATFKTEKGQPSLNSDAKLHLYRNGRNDVEKLVGQYLCLLVEINSLRSKYINPISESFHKTGKYHTSYGLTTTTTGRLSSGFHTLPSFCLDIKTLFCSEWKDQGGLIMAPDYSQLEVRVFASLAGDTDLRDAYIEDRDIHQFVASVMYKKSFENVTKVERSSAKQVVFGILYGKGVGSLAEELKITEAEAQNIFDLLLEAFPKIKEFINTSKEILHTHGYSVSAFGRYRWLAAAKLDPNADRRNKHLIAEAERGGVNHRIQSTASDVTLTSIIELDRIQYQKRMFSGVIGSVHDSLQLDIHPYELFPMYHQIKEVCQDRLQEYPWVNGVPYKMDVDMGMSWGTAMSTSIIEKSDDHLVLKVSGREYGAECLHWCLDRNQYYSYSIDSEFERTPWSADDEDRDRLYKGALNFGDKVKYLLTLKRK